MKKFEFRKTEKSFFYFQCLDDDSKVSVWLMEWIQSNAHCKQTENNSKAIRYLASPLKIFSTLFLFSIEQWITWLLSQALDYDRSKFRYDLNNLQNSLHAAPKWNFCGLSSSEIGESQAFGLWKNAALRDTKQRQSKHNFIILVLFSFFSFLILFRFSHTFT